MKKKRIIKPPKKIGGSFVASYDTDLKGLATLMSIKNFRGVYDLNSLPIKPKRIEEAIVRINGDHWVCYIKNGKYVNYFNSIGNKPPPIKLQNYLKNLEISWNKKRYQRRGTSYCGYLCLLFLKEILYKEVPPQ